MESLWILGVALILDALLGEPPRFLHPVVAMGKATALLGRLAPGPKDQGIPLQVQEGLGHLPQLLYGAVMVFLVVIAFALPAFLFRPYNPFLPLPLFILLAGFLLKTTFSLRLLALAALRVQRSLEREEEGKAREELRSLVSRHTATLRRPQMVSAAVESVAENLCDSFVAPLFYFALLGLPGALAYRVVNTMDAMIGYHGPWEYLGKAAARVDDALNFFPARLSALLIVAAAFLARSHAGNALRALRLHHGRTQSPNAGWSMSAMAGALGVELEKPGCYRLGWAREEMAPAKIGQAVKIMVLAAALYLVLEVALLAYLA